jgi:hypothetical protein
MTPVDELSRLTRQNAALVAALREMVYETTHLSPMRDDGSHACTISVAALAQSRAALSGTPDPVAETARKCVEIVESYSLSQHIARDIREGVFPEQSDVQVAIAEEIERHFNLGDVK